MKTALWILVCLFFGIAAFEAALLVALLGQNKTEQRPLKIEDKQRILSGELVAIKGPIPRNKPGKK